MGKHRFGGFRVAVWRIDAVQRLFHREKDAPYESTDGTLTLNLPSKVFRPRHSALCEPWDATVHLNYKLLGNPPGGYRPIAKRPQPHLGAALDRSGADDLCRQGASACILDRFVLYLAVKNIGECQKDRRCAHRAMLRAVADAVAVRAQVSRRQGDMLHGSEFHRFTSNRLIVGRSAYKGNLIAHRAPSMPSRCWAITPSCIHNESGIRANPSRSCLLRPSPGLYISAAHGPAASRPRLRPSPVLSAQKVNSSADAPDLNSPKEPVILRR